MGYLEELFNKIGATNQNIELGAQLDSFNASANVLNDNLGVGAKLKDIFNLQLAPSFTFDYSIVYIDSGCKYGAGRYKITSNSKTVQETPQKPPKLSNFQVGVKSFKQEDEEEKEDKSLILAVKNAIYYGFKWGWSGLSVKDTTYYSGSVINPVYDLNGEIKEGEVGPFYMLNFDVSKNDVKVSKKDEYSKGNFESTKDNCYLKIERDGIGHYVKLMKFIQVDIYLTRLLAINGSLAINKGGIVVKNPKTIKTEMEQLLTPDSNFYLILKDLQNARDMVSNEYIPPNDKPLGNINELILCYKTGVQHYYGLFGRCMESGKNNVLSSEANLTINQGENIAKNYDEKVQFFIDEVNERYNTNLVLEINENNKQDDPMENNQFGKETSESGEAKEVEKD